MRYLTREQRYTIASMLQNEYNQKKEIALVINKDKSVVSRQIRRSADTRSDGYGGDFSVHRYFKRLENKAKTRRIIDIELRFIALPEAKHKKTS